MKNTSIITVILILTAIFGDSINAQNAKDLCKNEISQQKQEYVQKLIVKKSPQPVVPSSCSQTSGTTQILATFDKSGKITNVEIKSFSGCEDFDENAVKAAKKIKFKPLVKNGEPLTVVKTISYTFNLYDSKKTF